MKRSSAIVALLALVAAGAFGELEVTGIAGAGSTLAKGTTIKGDRVKVDSYLRSSIAISNEDENGVVGGEAKLDVEINEASFNFSPRATAWWKPIPHIKFQLGTIDDFGLTDIVGWGYHANDAEEYVVSPKSYYAGDIFANTTGFYSGTGYSWIGAAVSVSPFYGLTLTLAVPYGEFKSVLVRDYNNPEAPPVGIHESFKQANATDVYERSQIQAAYEIWEVGRIMVTFAGGGNRKLENAPYWDMTTKYGEYYLKANTHSIYTSFFLTALESRGIYLNVGFGYTFSAKASGIQPKNQYGGDFDPTDSSTPFPDSSLVLDLEYQPPMAAGLGFSLGSDRIGIKTQLAATFGGKMKASSGDSLSEPLKIGLGILPYFMLGPCKININAGISYRLGESELANAYEETVRGYRSDAEKITPWTESEMTDRLAVSVPDSAALGWFFNPYLALNVSFATIYAGIQFESDGRRYVMGTDNELVVEPKHQDSKMIVRWGVPIGIQLVF